MSNDENGNNDEGGGSSTGQAASKGTSNTEKKSSTQLQNTDSVLVEMDVVQTAEESIKSSSSAVLTNPSTIACPATTSTTSVAEVPSTATCKSESDDDAVTSRTISDESSTDVTDNCLVKDEERTAMEEDRSPQATAAAAPATVVDDSLTPASTVVSLNSEITLPVSESNSSNTTLKDSSRETSSAKTVGPKVTFKIIFMGKKHEVEMPLSSTILDLKHHLATVIEVPPSMQKIMIKGLASDTKTLADLGVTRTSKVLVVGSKFDDVVGINLDKPSARGAESPTVVAAAKAEPLCTQKLHKKVLEKGPPEDVHPGMKSAKESLPPHPLSGMVNKSGDKVRLTFKLELDQIWIGTRQRTEKVNMGSIRHIVSEPIEGKEEYHIMGLQLGTTEASRYWIYWVPAQYVDAIKHTVLGGSSAVW